ncbi:aminoacylase [Hymenobacter sedentarius]|uniref:Aminoacylase n=1 Tax=Hymenobacter sedentarius TaxID=1411621 RepID=A0A0U4AKE6_9BACT|nr:D-aminoacylase [Hymenobacter sedentarius]ALW84064.1 aminoacylase [Hymenobacter sedentarius]
MKKQLLFLLLLPVLCTCGHKSQYATIIRNGLLYDGRGGAPFKGDIALNADTIAAMGNLANASADVVVDARGMAVCPGFINMLSQTDEELLVDGRSQSDLRQGVTLEVMGEGSSMGPLNARTKKQLERGQADIKYPIAWTSLGEYLTYLEKKGVSCNVASFVGATTVRLNVVGEDDRAPTAGELDRMRLLVRQAMQEGAMGVSTSLIYAPAFFAKTDELIALCQEAAKYHGMYISHLRSEGNKLEESVEELMTIAKEAHIPAEIYHLKAGGMRNWGKMDGVIRRIEKARAAGLHITANMYTYTAGATGLTACFPPALQDGGFGALRKRLQDPTVRAATVKAMHTDAQDWENFYYGVGNPDNILLLAFKQDSLKKYSGKTLAAVAKIRGTSPEETAMNLVVQDSTRVVTGYFMMNEQNVKKQVALPWMSFGSDAGSMAPEGVFLKSSQHPRAYGNFARVLGKYARDENVMPLQEAIRKLANLPATNLKLQKRGELKVGNFADVLVFDPAKVVDHATFAAPHQYATGMTHVFVNGIQVLKNGEHTGAKPGRFVKGPGYRRK